MDEERVEREGHRLKKKAKHRDEEGKAKDKLKRRTDEKATEADSVAEKVKEEAVVGAAEEKEGHKRKKGKGRSEETKSKENVPVVSGSIENGVGEEQAKKSGSMAPCSEGAMNKDNVKKDKKRRKEEKKKEKEADMTEQKQSFDTTVGKEQAETSGLMEVTPCLELAQGDMSKDKVKKVKKKKKEEKEAEKTGQQKQTFDTTVGNSGAKYAEGDKVEGKQSSKAKKSKRKSDDGAPAADQIVTREYKKKKKEHSVVLEESSQTENSNEGENREIKKGGKERSKASPDFSENASAGGEEAGVDGNDDKKKKKSKGIGGGKKEKEKSVRSTKGKQVSFADSAEMFRTEGGDGEGIGGGKQKEKAALSKKKGKRVSFANSAEVFSIEGGDNEEDGISNESKSVHGRFTPEEDAALMEAMRGYAERNRYPIDLTWPYTGEHIHYSIGAPDVNGQMKKKSRFGDYVGVKKLKREGQQWSDLTCLTLEQNLMVTKVSCIGEGGDWFVEKNGTDWKTLAQELGKSEIHVKHAWRRIKPKKKKGADDEEDVSGGESELVHGHRFTTEEDAILMEAMRDYAEVASLAYIFCIHVTLKQLGEKGLEMIGSCSKYPELKGCWDDIGRQDSQQGDISVSDPKDAHLTIRSPEVDVELHWSLNNVLIRKSRASKKILDVLPLGYQEAIGGRWTQDEHQNLFDLVNLDLRLKAHQIKNPDHRLLRDNISWEAISDKLTTRNHKNCCLKWYETLASPMVKEGVWADVDDYLLVEALQKVDAVCIEDVDWDSLLDHRSGEVCRQRWNQMVRAIGGHREKPFIEQVEVLSRRYCPEMIEYRK
ncbi:unnamed protein product [Triticum turgidum subsp. durum]|uniref:Myb-like domain-containing protein n=3 Tax=Triticinae TaxID=1648030 RepID=A0A9R0ZB24_TRITD|nr:unnamed protein product [Triticum turgidum subsp. durum]